MCCIQNYPFFSCFLPFAIPQLWQCQLTLFSGGNSYGRRVKSCGITLYSTKAQTGEYPLNCWNLYVNFIFAVWFSLTCFSPVNRTLSLVLLLCTAPSPGLHAPLCPLWSSRQAHEASAASHSGFHSHLLPAAPQRSALHHLHFPSSQFGGCPRLLFHVGWLCL